MQGVGECRLHLLSGGVYHTLCGSLALRGGRTRCLADAFRRKGGVCCCARRLSPSTMASTLSFTEVASCESVCFAGAGSATHHCLEDGGRASLRRGSMESAIASPSGAPSSYSSSSSSSSMPPHGRTSTWNDGLSSVASSPGPGSPIRACGCGGSRCPSHAGGHEGRPVVDYAIFGGVPLLLVFFVYVAIAA